MSNNSRNLDTDGQTDREVNVISYKQVNSSQLCTFNPCTLVNNMFVGIQTDALINRFKYTFPVAVVIISFYR